MKKSWIIGLILFISIASNITLASVIVGKKMNQHRQPMRVFKENLKTLPDIDKRKIFKALREKKRGLRSKMKELRETRNEVYSYIGSDAYNRTEAEQKLADLREKTMAIQKAAQDMVLDIGDKLTPKQRAHLLKKTTGKGRGRVMP